MHKTIYQVKGVDFAYPGKPPLTVFHQLNWTMQEGENWALLGPSGCGKSTLLHLLAGILKPDRGQVDFFGQPVQAADARIGMVLQSYGLFPWKTVAQNVDLPLKLAGLPRAERRRRVSERLHNIGLESFAQTFPRALSGGQRQRVAIARALILDPSILLMDEPFSALDAIHREKLQDDVLAMTRSRGVHFVLVTHQIEEAVRMADKIFLFGQTAAPPRIIDQQAATSKDRSDASFMARAAQIRQLLRGEGANV